MKMRTLYMLLCSSALLGACSEIPPEAYHNRSDPENLLDVSSEVVHFDLTVESIPQLADLMVQDPPTRAELGCVEADMLCSKAKSILTRHGVATAPAKDSSHGITLIYDRVIARDCENRYIDNSINPYNLNHTTFGCSVTGNIVQSVSDKRQFTDPTLLDFEDGEHAASTYEHYLHPDTAPQPKQDSNTNWTISSGSSQ